MVDKMLGMICFIIIISDFCFDIFVYKMYLCFFIDNVFVFIIWVVFIYVSNLIIRISVVIFGFKYVFNSSIKKNDGIDISILIICIKKLFNFLLKYLLIVLIVVLIVIEIIIVRKLIVSEICLLYNVFVK